MRKIYFLLLLMIVFVLVSCNSFDLYEDIIDKVVEITCENKIGKSFGTGTLVSNDGMILTNKHIIEYFMEDSSIKVNFNNDINNYDAEIYEVSDIYDLCLIKIDKDTEYFEEISTDIRITDEVYTIGNANGFGLAFQKGVISSEYKNIIYNNVNILTIQTTIEIYNGSSGGPLYNSKGELLGLMTLRIKDDGFYIPGMSFAIPSKVINEFLGGIK